MVFLSSLIKYKKSHIIIMKTLITKIFPEYEGIDTTHEIEIPDSISWELRFYCDECSNELAEIDLKNHQC